MPVGAAGLSFLDLEQVQAYTELERRHTHGKIVLQP
jgi:hypothetical protein